MRYVVYAVLVVLGLGGLLFGVSLINSPAHEGEALFLLLIGTVALGALCVIIAIEHAAAQQVKELRELLRFSVQAEKRAAALDAAMVQADRDAK